jgi:hypothetical protein
VIANDDNTDPLYILLQRAVYEEGTHEGEASWSLFKRKARGQKGKVVFMTQDFANPLMFIVKEHEEHIERLEAENQHLREQIERSGIIMKKKPEKNFPWHEYPEVEQRAMKMLFEGGSGNQEIIDYIDGAVPELAGRYTTHVNARFVKGRPNNFATEIEVKEGSGPTTWMELWKIATLEYGEGWIKRVMRYAGAWAKFKDKNTGTPKGWNRRDPNKYIGAREMAKLRERFHRGDFLTAKVELLKEIEDAGKDGLTKEQMSDFGLDLRRLQEVVKTDEVFVEGDRHIHWSQAPLFPQNHGARIAMEKYTVELATRVHGSEHREGRQGKGRKRSPAAT